MAKRMLIDATHPEETRVVVLSGNRLEEFDFESSTKKQVKGNIYLAKVTRVEPSLQAAFVDYGGNRHGFLAFSEIHPDYYRIPVADRGTAENGETADEAEAEQATAEEAGVPLVEALPEPVMVSAEPEGGEDDAAESEPSEEPQPATDEIGSTALYEAEPRPEMNAADLPWEDVAPGLPETEPLRCRRNPPSPTLVPIENASPTRDEPIEASGELPSRSSWDYLAVARAAAGDARAENGRDAEENETVETIGGDEIEEAEQPALAHDPPLQDPGGDQAPADHAGAGRQGRARQQGRGADHLPFARRALLRADAEHGPRRRRFAQDHQHRPTAAG